MPKGASWRAAGLNYLQASNIAAKALRRALKDEFRNVAIKREEHALKAVTWTEGEAGKTRHLYQPQA